MVSAGRMPGESDRAAERREKEKIVMSRVSRMAAEFFLRCAACAAVAWPWLRCCGGHVAVAVGHGCPVAVTLTPLGLLLSSRNQSP